MNGIDAATILMTSRVMEIASNLRIDDMKKNGKTVAEWTDVPSEQYIGPAVEKFFRQVMLVQQAVEGHRS